MCRGGRAQVVGDGVGEGFEFLVGGGQFGSAHLDAMLEVGIEFEDLIFEAFAFGDVAGDGGHADDAAVGVANG